jgi:adenylosuccinate synthase
MANTVVVGAQWGDEAKGKVVDFLAGNADLVVRFNGGNNAGHTVVVDGQTYKFHLVPCGVLRPETLNIIGDGEVIDPAVLVKEFDTLASHGISTDRLRISLNAHIIMPYHQAFDRLEEERKGSKAIGTTARGIGPAYADKASRVGIRVADLIDPIRLRAALAANLEFKNQVLTKIYGAEPFSEDKLFEEYSVYGAKIKPLAANTDRLTHEAYKQGKNILFEGAQGTLLDLDYGTYPYVTSSHPVAGGACLGTGIGPRDIDRVIGIAKAYTTRVGAGVFPTELFDETGEFIRERGHEYGTTTGRARRCGWLDAVVLRYAAMVNGLSEFAVTLLDVLTGIETLKICRAYRCDGIETEHLPADWEAVRECVPIYEELPGWTEDLTGMKSYDEFPANAKAYVRRVEELTGVAVKIISIGPDRSETLVRE